MSGPLAGVKVLDLSIAVTGPFASALLADQGADVVKVERPDIGDITRWLGAAAGGMTALYRVSNRGKRGVAIDIRRPEGRDLVLSLAAASDVVVQNFLPGTVSRLGLSYEDVAARNPDVVYVSISGFGEVGPYADRPAYDTVMQAYGGLASLQAAADGVPVFLQQAAADKLTSIMAAQAITAALFARSNGRGGQHVHLSMVDAVASFVWTDSAGNEVLLDADGSQPSNMFAGFPPIRLADGWAIITPVADSDFVGMCKALDVDDWRNPDLATAPQRTANRELMRQVLDRCYANAVDMTMAEATVRFQAQGVPWAPILSPADLPDDEHARAMELFVERDDPVVGRIRLPRHPVLFDGTPAELAGPAPTLGQHADEVLAEVGVHDLTGLRDAGVVL